MLTLVGVAGLGAVFGWYLYHVNRWREDTVQISDLATVVTALAGAGLTALFENKDAMLGAYGLGLALGFFGYFIVLWRIVHSSKAVGTDWFLTGRIAGERDQRPLGVEKDLPRDREQ